MEEPRFTLYWVVEKRYRRTFDTDGIIPMSIIYNIGLREDWYEAVIRAHYYAKGGEVTPESHFLLRIQFSAVGFMHYSTTSAGRDYGYSPVLYKQVYRIVTREMFSYYIGFSSGYDLMHTAACFLLQFLFVFLFFFLDGFFFLSHFSLLRCCSDVLI